jgi:hypothetical protein
MRRILKGCLLAAALAAPVAAQADVRITEFMYQGSDSGNREFFELTNLSGAQIDISAWTYNDSNVNDPVAFGSAFGMLNAWESIVLTEMTPAAFAAYWGLPASVRIFSIGGNSNLGGSDTINIYNSAVQNAGTLVDSVSYSGTTRGISRNRPVGVSGLVLNSAFVNSSVGDLYGSYLSPTSPKDVGNPGYYVPEPSTWAMMIGGFALVGAGLRRRVRFVAA